MKRPAPGAALTFGAAVTRGVTTTLGAALALGAALLALAANLAPALAQPVAPSAPASAPAAPIPAFDGIGAEHLEDDAFAIPFARAADGLAPAAAGPLEALLARARQEAERPLCILGHAGPQEGGAATNARLAARRAGVVADYLARQGLPRDRLRAEVRVAAFARGTGIPAGRSVTVVLLPAP